MKSLTSLFDCIHRIKKCKNLGPLNRFKKDWATNNWIGVEI